MSYTTIITMTKTTHELKADTKTVFVKTSHEVKELSEQEYNNITNTDTLRFFRRLGGTETATKGYTVSGYKVVRLVSKSPCRTIKHVREFRFQLVDARGRIIE